MKEPGPRTKCRAEATQRSPGAVPAARGRPLRSGEGAGRPRPPRPQPSRPAGPAHPPPTAHPAGAPRPPFALLTLWSPWPGARSARPETASQNRVRRQREIGHSKTTTRVLCSGPPPPQPPAAPAPPGPAPSAPSPKRAGVAPRLPGASVRCRPWNGPLRMQQPGPWGGQGKESSSPGGPSAPFPSCKHLKHLSTLVMEEPPGYSRLSYPEETERGFGDSESQLKCDHRILSQATSQELTPGSWPLSAALQPSQEPAAFDKSATPFDFCPCQISVSLASLAPLPSFPGPSAFPPPHPGTAYGF
nr:vegetative cell wall protein gp1-like [Camelus dromedarius]